MILRRARGHRWATVLSCLILWSVDGAAEDCCDAQASVAFSLERVSHSRPFARTLGARSEGCRGAAAARTVAGEPVYLNIVSQNTGVQGWSFTLALGGDLKFSEVATDGTAAAPAPEGRVENGFRSARLVAPRFRAPGFHGAVTAVVLCFGCSTTLPPTGTESVLRMTFDPIAEQAESAKGRLRLAPVDFSDEAIDNVITVDAFSVFPCNEESVELELELLPSKRFKRGDVNADGKVNMSDVIAGIEALLEPSRSPRFCWAALDTNRDGRVNISDPIFTLNFLFRSGDELPSPGGDECGFDIDSELDCEGVRSCA